jgi:Listeria-Bacteroides repeat domain (List_Bact_rpt).
MKQTILTILLTLLTLLANAEAIEINGIYYNLVQKAKAAEVTSNPDKYSGTIIIPESVKYEGVDFYVTSIGNNAFSKCTGLTSVTIPNSVKSIGSYVFSGCTSLFSLTIPNSVTFIDRNCFENCRNLTSVTIGNSVTAIGKFAFSGCNGLTSVYINDLEAWCNITFESNSSNPLCFAHKLFLNNEEINDLIIPNSVTSINKYVFAWCLGLKSVTIPNSVTSIGVCAFQNCSGLTSVSIPNSVTSIGNSSFSDCSNLTSVTIGNNVTSIDHEAFRGCNSLTSITIPNSVTTIGQWVFKGCKKLKHVNIGNGIKSINTEAFGSCPELTDVYCHSENVPNTKKDAFKDSYIEYAVLHIPSISVNDYKNAEPWKDFMKIVGIENAIYTLTYIVDGNVYKTLQMEENETITPEENPTKEGYTFSGWSEIPETMPNHDVIVTGTFIINKYKLIYMVDGEEYKSYDIEYNSTITPEEEPIKEGYTFSGWSEIPETMPANDVTITGSFERVYSGGDVANLIDILLIGNIGDDDIALYDMNGDGELNIGDLILIIRAVNDSNNRSVANRAATGSQTVGFDTDNITMKLGETAVLNISLSNSANGIYGLQFEVSLPDGFSLENGSDDKVYEMSTNQPDDIICSNLKLENGVYRFFIYSSTLQELRGGSLMSLNLKADDNMALDYYNVNMDNIALSDYDGNVTKKNGITAGVKVTDFFTLLYKIDGEDYKSYEIEYGDAITPEAEPTKEGYTFSGWSEIPSTMPAKDVTITGGFTINKYKLIYMVDGELYDSYDIEYGASISPETEPTKEGYTFSGWSEIPETMPANDVNVTGTFTINKYKVTYIIDGEEYKTEEVEYGSTITPPNPDDREGYDFAWGDYPSTMPAKDITITGSYTVGIKTVLAVESDVKIYTVSGKSINKLQKGVNILRYKDGRTKKIVIK